MIVHSQAATSIRY